MSYFEDFLNEDSGPDQGPKEKKKTKSERSKILGGIKELKASVRTLDKTVKKNSKLLKELLNKLNTFLERSE
jgi:hypothetical protein